MTYDEAAPTPPTLGTCPTCRGEVRADGKARPFCCERCRLIDLGRWFNEEYAVPGEDAFSFDVPDVSFLGTPGGFPDGLDDGDGR